MELKGTRVLVVGLGESGLAMAKWLHRQGAHVRVADSRDNPPNLEALALVAPTAEVIAGPFAAATFAGIDLVALSPGVPKATPHISAVNVPVVSEIELFAAGVREQAPEGATPDDFSTVVVVEWIYEEQLPDPHLLKEMNLPAE